MRIVIGLLLVIAVIGLLLVIAVGCTSSLDKSELNDGGMHSMGNGLFLKRIDVSYGMHVDRVYIVVDESGKIVSGTSASHTVSNGKGSHIESNAVIVPWPYGTR